MFSNFLITRFVKDNEKVEDETVRNAYGYLSGAAGIAVNFTVFVIELLIGLLINSIAITADAFHNLSDVASSIITILGFKLASKPADEDHPFGHGRIEYISAMIVSFIIIIVGVEFVKTSFDRMLHPVEVQFSIVTVVLIVISIPLKVWLSAFIKKLGKRINSTPLKAASADAFNDVVILSGVAASLLLTKLITIPLDGYIGLLVAGFILHSGFSLAKETLNPLLGEAPDPVLVESIKNGVLDYEYISGVHDLVIHNYGPGRCMASIHAEIPCDISVVKIHEVIDKAEKELSKKLKIFLVIHMDPVNTDDKEIAATRDELLEVLEKFPIITSMHDFRVVGDGEDKNLIFDVVINHIKKINKDFDDNLAKAINRELQKLHPKYNAVITVDRDFTSL